MSQRDSSHKGLDVVRALLLLAVFHAVMLLILIPSY